MKYLLAFLFALTAVAETAAQSPAQTRSWTEEGMERIRRLETSIGDSLKYASELFSTAQYCKSLGMYRQSKELAELSVRILEEKLKTTPKEAAYPIHKELAYAYTFLSDLSVFRKNVLLPGGMLEKLAATNHTLAVISESMGLLMKAMDTNDSRLYRQAEKMQKDLPDNWDAESVYHWEQNDLNSAVKLLEERLEKHEDTPETAASIRLRLKMLALLNDSTPAAAEQCMDIAEKTYRPASVSQVLGMQRLPECFLVFRTCAQIYAQSRQPEKALETYDKMLEYLYSLMEEDLPYLFPSERSVLWDIVQTYYNDMQRFACQNMRMLGIAEFLYDSNLLKKELFTAVPLRQQELSMPEQDRYCMEIRQEIDSIRFSESSFKKGGGREYVRRLRNEITVRNLERALGAYLKEKHKNRAVRRRGWKEIAACLSPEEAVAEIISLPVSPDFLNKEYWAVVFTSNDTVPHVTSLCTYLELPYLIVDKREAYNRLWTPIGKLAGGCSHIYLSLDGNLNTIPFARLFDGKQYVCEKYVLHHLSYTGDIPAIKKRQESRKDISRDIILFGGAEFNLPPDSVYGKKRGQGFAYLPGTVIEIDSISRLLSASNRWNIHKYTGREANETAFRKLSRRPFSSAVLHIATHGFNLPYNDSIQSPAIAYKGESGHQDPLMRTGFLLSGANEAWTEHRPAGGKEDGILTALEISSLDLSRIELAVLSSCYSAEGEIEEAEGVFGLRRAFRLAGVESMLVSLWEVGDKATVELMTDFYRFWQTGMGKQEAFTCAQRNMIRKYPHNIRDWSGFILIE